MEFVKELKFNRRKKTVKQKIGSSHHYVTLTYSLERGNLIMYVPLKEYTIPSRGKRKIILIKNAYNYNRQYYYFLRGNKIFRKPRLYYGQTKKGTKVLSEEEFKRKQIKKKKQTLQRLQKKILKIQNEVKANSSHD